MNTLQGIFAILILIFLLICVIGTIICIWLEKIHKYIQESYWGQIKKNNEDANNRELDVKRSEEMMDVLSQALKLHLTKVTEEELRKIIKIQVEEYPEPVATNIPTDKDILTAFGVTEEEMAEYGIKYQNIPDTQLVAISPTSLKQSQRVYNPNYGNGVITEVLPTDIGEMTKWEGAGAMIKWDLTDDVFPLSWNHIYYPPVNLFGDNPESFDNSPLEAE